MLKSFSLLILSTFFLFSCQMKTKTKTTQNCKENTKPNIIFILADDLGIGDVSYTGQQKFETPNIDKLANEGMIFTQHYAGSTVCSPSRSTLMTGQHTGHTPVRGNKYYEENGENKGNWPLPAKTKTVADILKANGYATGCFGKWGLGFTGSTGDPNNKGFDEFWGYNNQRMAHNYYPETIDHNRTTVKLEGNQGKGHGTYAPNFIHKKALKFIEDNKEKPFFIYYPSIIPHAELFAPETYMEKYRGKLLPEKEFKGVDDGPRYKKGGYGSQPESHAAFAAMINLLDDQVGEIVDKLNDLGIADNTLIIFSSDNGPHQEGGADPDYFDSNGIFTGYKRDLYEGGIRMPMIAWCPGKIAAGSKTDLISAFWDFLPTVTDLIGAKNPENTDGISYLPTLLGKDGQKEHEYMYWEFHEKNGRVALRKGDWKLVRYNVCVANETTTELYNLKKDPSEKDNLAAQYPEKVEELMGLLDSASTKSEDFPF